MPPDMSGRNRRRNNWKLNLLSGVRSLALR
jgi:hypothetical protein